MARLRLKVNGHSHDVEAAPDAPLLYVLRNDLELNSPKFGCGLGRCGACTVLIDGAAVHSCTMSLAEIDTANGSEIVTLEGLGTESNPHPVQQAFIDEQATQCGYCLSGMIIGTKALLDRNADPSEAEIKQVLAGYLCRCLAQPRIIRAVKRAAALLAQESPDGNE